MDDPVSLIIADDGTHLIGTSVFDKATILTSVGPGHVMRALLEEIVQQDQALWSRTREQDVKAGEELLVWNINERFLVEGEAKCKQMEEEFERQIGRAHV